MIKHIKRFFRRGWLIKIPKWSDSYRLLLQDLNQNKHFSLSRWGDGEWESALHLKNQNEANCDGHQYFDSMSDELSSILLRNPNYYFGMQELAYLKMMGNKIDKFLKANKIRVNWINADAFHFASVRGELNSFFEALNNKRILLVGPSYLKNVNILSFDLIEVPPVNCWLKRDEILNAILMENGKYDVVLFCAGMTSNWFVDQLHGKFKGFVIDVGSLLDPYAGKETRNYHRKLKIH
jgi:hypothetical protein